jgi:anaerobic ribonucleoside-triphosphate reductase activating protein
VKLKLHGFEGRSRANGPGLRAVVWFQGCTLGCPGCFNPTTHTIAGGYTMAAQTVADDISRATGDTPPIEGVTLSGGEPLEQPEGLLRLLRLLEAGPAASLGTILFSGYSHSEIRAMPLGPAVLARLDAVICGRYVQARHVGRALIGSSNQELRLLTNRYSRNDFERVPRGEVIIRGGGSITYTGIAPPQPLAPSKTNAPRAVAAR